MGIHFICKTKPQSIFKNDLAVGRSTFGIDGKTGNTGENGASIHFSDYTPNNDYIKGIMIEKINNGLVLSSGNTIKLEKLQYVDGDIILTRDLFVYRLCIEDNKTDFRFLGKIIDRNREYSETDEETLMNNIAGVEFKNWEPGTFNISIPSNRCMDSSTDILLQGYDYTYWQSQQYSYTNYQSTAMSYRDSYKITFGFRFNPIIKVTSPVLLNNWSFYLRIYFKNKKSPQSNSYILEENDYGNFKDPTQETMQGAFEFYKYAEIKLNANYGNSYQTPINQSISKYNITDMSCDKLHPSGNGINPNYVGCENYLVVENGQRRVRMGGIDSIPLYSQYSYNETNTNYDDKGGDPKGSIPIGGARPGSERTSEPLGMPLSQGAAHFQQESMQKFLVNKYADLRGYVQYSRYDNGTPNFRSGDSAYFSGLYKENYANNCFYKSTSYPSIVYNANHTSETSSGELHPYDNFVKHEMLLNPMFHLSGDTQDYTSTYVENRKRNEQAYVCGILYNFILNSENIYELVCVNRKTGLIKTMETKINVTN